jgi:hypothetical protein
MVDLSRPDPTDLQRAILKAAAYADVFDYPLTAAEIQRYLPEVPAGLQDVQAGLSSSDGLCPDGDFYTLPGRQALADIRRSRQAHARQLWREAVRYGKVLAALPFVRMLAVTGSLAMNNGGPGTDIDYLVVTVPGRVWTCRALILGVARLAALRGVRLCPNYLVSTQALAFPDQTLYAAHELAQMVPIFGQQVYAEIRCQNRWAEHFLPNAAGAPELAFQIPPMRCMPGVKPALECGLQLPPGDWFERWEMQRKIEDPEAAFAADFCKGHLSRHAETSQGAYRQRLKTLRLEAEP